MRLIHKKSLIAFVFVALVLFSLLCGGVGGKAYAAVSVSGYSNVLDDLRKDESFNPDDYPAIDGDYSLQVIQIAESTAGELFVYVYRPFGSQANLNVTTLRFSTIKNGDQYISYDPSQLGGILGGIVMVEPWDDYELELLNFNGVFFKYKVKDFAVLTEEIRYYNLTSIYREYIEGIDDKPAFGNEISEVEFAIGELWVAYDFNGEVRYNHEVSDIVTIRPDQKHVGMLRYTSGWLPFGYVEKCDSHYVAFDCDYQIDQLYSARVYYTKEEFILSEGIFVRTSAVKDSKTDCKTTLNAGDKGGVTVSGLFAQKYEWSRIQRVADFINDPANSDLTDEAKSALRDKQWVLRFTETEYEKYNAMNTVKTDYWEVSDVTILRLHFKSNGKVYNLGVVDNKQAGSGEPENPSKPLIPSDDDDKSLLDKIIDFFVKVWNFLKQLEWWHLLLIGVGVIAVIVLIVCLIKFGIKAVFKVVWLVISAPFRFIGWVFKKIRRDE